MYKSTLIASPSIINDALRWCDDNCQGIRRPGAWTPIFDGIGDDNILIDSQEFKFELESDFFLFNLVWQ